MISTGASTVNILNIFASGPLAPPLPSPRNRLNGTQHVRRAPYHVLDAGQFRLPADLMPEPRILFGPAFQFIGQLRRIDSGLIWPHHAMRGQQRQPDTVQQTLTVDANDQTAAEEGSPATRSSWVISLAASSSLPFNSRPVRMESRNVRSIETRASANLA